MTHLLQKINKRKLAAVLVLLVVLALSMTVVQKAASDPENHTGTIEALDEKKADVLKLTASSAAAATALAAVPGDATTPVAKSLTPCGSATMSGCDKKSKICFMKGDKQAKIMSTARAARTVRLRSSIKCETNGCSLAGSSGPSRR